MTCMVVVLVSFGIAESAVEVVLDNGVPATGYLGGDTVQAGSSVRFDIRYIFTPGDGSAITGPTNGFRVWTYANGTTNYTNHFTPITYDTMAINWASMYDAGVFMNPFGIDGLNEDTIGLGAFRISGPGMVDGFSDTMIWIETTPSTSGDTLCIDSTWYPPSNQWMWSGTAGKYCDIALVCPCGVLNWGGPYCFHVYSEPDNLEIDSTSLTFDVDQIYAIDTSTIRITSSGGAAKGELDFTTTADEAWLKFDTAGGTGGPNETLTGMTPMDVLVIVDFSGLDTGQYTAAVTVTSTSAGNSPLTMPVAASVGSDVAVPGEIPTSYALSQNYPNPFNPITEINFDIPVRSHVTLTVYNVVGQMVKTLVDEELAPKHYIVDWDGTTDNGTKVASGIYFYKLEAGDFTETKKMLLLK